MTFRLILAGFVFWTAALAAFAQTGPALNPNLRRAVAPVQAVESFTAHQSTIYGSAAVAPSSNVKSGSGWALSGFAVNFKNGDHKLNAMGVEFWQAEGAVHFTFQDQDSNDPFNAEASFYHSPAFFTAATAAMGSGAIDIPIATRAGYTPVLAGFQFKRGDRRDANLRTIGIRLAPFKDKYRVILLDDQGVDFRGLETAAAAGFSLLGLDPFMATATLVTPAAFKAANPGEIDPKTKLRRYAVNLQYTLVPNSQIAAEGKLSGSSRMYESGRRPQQGEKLALQGFLLHFQDSDHHVLQIGLAPEKAAGPGNPVYFCDGDCVRKKIQWQAEYVALK